MKKINYIIWFLLVVGSVITSVSAFELQPFETTYTAAISKVPFNGQAKYSLKQNGARWDFKTEASMLIASRSEQSIFTLDSHGIKPVGYEFRQTGIKPKHTLILFDWQKKFAKGHVKSKKKDVDIFFDLKYKMLDQLSSQLALQMDVATGKKTMSYPVIEDDELDTFDFKVVGNEVINTPVGKLDTVKIERVRGAQSKRKSYIWFAKDWNFTVVRLYHLEKDGQEYIISLAKGKVNGKEIKGK